MHLTQQESATRRSQSHIVSSAPPAPQGETLPRVGFTLVEVMILVVIIGLLAGMAMPAFQKARISTQNTRVSNDLRVFREGFSNYSLDEGQWPPDSAPGEMPPQLEGYVTATVFEARTVVGGRYDWNFQDGAYEASIAMVDTFMDQSQALDIDARVDDGDLSTGQFRANGADYVLILEE